MPRPPDHDHLRPDEPSPSDRDRPLRVAFDVGPLHGHQTGIGRAVEQMSLALEERAGIELRPYVISARAAHRPGQTRLPLPGIAASHLWSRTSLLRADRWIGTVDVVHGTNYVAPPTDRPTVVSVYDCWFLAHPELANPVVARAGAWLRRTVRRGAWVHCSSDATATEAERLLGTDRIRAIHLGPPAPPAAPDASMAQRRRIERADIVAVGTEERRKGFPELVDAFGVLAERQPDVRLAIAGATGDDSGIIDAAIAGLAPSARRRVARLGPITDGEKAWLLEQASVLAYPSLDEGFGFPLLEANQFSLPVVARAAGSIAEIAGDTAVIVADDANFVANYADALGEVLANAELARRLVAAGQSNLMRFSWERCATELVELYQTAIDSHRSAATYEQEPNE